MHFLRWASSLDGAIELFVKGIKGSLNSRHSHAWLHSLRRVNRAWDPFLLARVRAAKQGTRGGVLPAMPFFGCEVEMASTLLSLLWWWGSGGRLSRHHHQSRGTTSNQFSTHSLRHSPPPLKLPRGRRANQQMSYDEIEIEDMKWSEELQAYTYPCPCGDVFQISLVRKGVPARAWSMPSPCACLPQSGFLHFRAGRLEIRRGHCKVPELLVVYNRRL